jgi:hypothetical protein
MPTAQELSEQDPFNGSGLKLPFPEEITQADAAVCMELLYPGVPYIIWERHAWLDGQKLSPTEQDEAEHAWISYLSDTRGSEGVSDPP